jgi:hypothetical protein
VWILRVLAHWIHNLFVLRNLVKILKFSKLCFAFYLIIALNEIISVGLVAVSMELIFHSTDFVVKRILEDSENEKFFQVFLRLNEII